MIGKELSNDLIQNLISRIQFNEIQLKLLNQTVEFYKFQISSYKKAVLIWLMVSKHGLFLIKDMRIFIAEKIWETRMEALY